MASRLSFLQKFSSPNPDAIKLKISQLIPGLCLCIVIVLAAHYVSDHVGGPIVLIALLMGMILRHVANHDEFIVGLDFAASTVLRLGIALLGIKITLTQVTSLGFKPFIILASVPLTILFSIFLSRMMGISRSQGLIAGCSVGICGVAAAVAVSSILPNKKEQHTYLVCLLLGVTGVSSVVMLLYPAISYLLAWPTDVTGLFLGATIHDVAHVAAAGYMVSDEVGDTAIYMKMLRVASLMPIVMCIAWFVSKKSPQAEKPTAFPLFLIGFVAIALTNNLMPLPTSLQSFVAKSSTLCLLVAMVAIGVKVNFAALVAIGKKTFTLLLLNTLFIAALCGLVVML